jgi:hypothetical protein
MKRYHCIGLSLVIFALPFGRSAGQNVRIITIDHSSSILLAELTPSQGQAQYTVHLEWSRNLMDGWTNGWRVPFSEFPVVDGFHVVPVPSYYRIAMTPGHAPTGGVKTNYIVTGTVQAAVHNGFLRWPTQESNRTYHVEFALTDGGEWFGHWISPTNVTISATTTNSIRVPMRFRVLTIEPDEGVEYPW